MSKILVVFGATGQQGGTVIDFVINDPELSEEYQVRAVTRDASKPAALALQEKGVEVVEADMDDLQSLKRAVQCSHTVFAVTASVYDENLKPRELSQGKAIADACVFQEIQYIIYSTLPQASKISNNKYPKVDHFDGKAEIETYIRGLPIKHAFFAPGFFMQNFKTMMALHPNGNGTYAISNIVKSHTQLPLFDVVSDSGKYVGAILADLEKYEGKIISASGGIYTLEEIAHILSNATGKVVTYNKMPEEVYRGFLPPPAADQLVQMFYYYQDFGYYGPQSRATVELGAKSSRKKPVSFEEFVAMHPFQLQ